MSSLDATYEKLIERAWDEGYEDAKGQRSPLVSRVEALEQVQRVERYLFAVTYATDGRGSRTWSQWYADIHDAVQKLKESELWLRYDIARRIGATLVD